MKKVILLAVIVGLISCKKVKENSQGENFTTNVDQVEKVIVDDSEQLTFFNNKKKSIEPILKQFSTGSVQPKGWILEMMNNDLEQGIVGALDDLYPGIKSDDLYNTARRGGMEDIPEMGGLELTGAEWEKSIMWWNSETIGNWWDGFIRHAFMTGNKKAIQQSHDIINNLLDSQDADGYIGIYKPNLRYQHEGSNGELWAQTTAFRAMLAYYEFTRKEEVLVTVERAMKLTMRSYSDEGKNPFELKNEFGGVTHGLMLTDVCETLFRITGNIDYQNYATYLYKAFSTYAINQSFNDLRYPYLMKRDSLFKGHAVHTYEHIRTVVNAYYNTGYPELETAYNNMLAKLEPCILPSGAGHGNEWISKLTAHPSTTSSEFCSMLELRNSYGSLIQKTGNTKFSDAAEKLTYNAMLGARNTSGTAICYGKPDNCYVLDGKHHDHDKSQEDVRYKYSPTHSEPAVCCVPNYARNLTYFLDQMWMKKDEKSIVVNMYGPSELTTKIGSNEIIVEQKTNYPLSDDITFTFKMNAPQRFSFLIRKPQWPHEFEGADQFDNLVDGYYVASKNWKNGDQIKVTFKSEIEIKNANNDEVYFQRGPLVFAYEIPHTEKTIKKYVNSSFTDYYCFPKSEEHRNFKIGDHSDFQYVMDNSSEDIYNSKIQLQGNVLDLSTMEEINIKLVPLGKTILRRVTFPRSLTEQ